MTNEIIMLSDGENKNNNTIKLSDSNAFVYAEQAKLSAENAIKSVNSAREYMQITQEYKNYMDSNIANFTNIVEEIHNVEELQANAESMYNRMYFGEYFDETENVWLTYKKVEFDENDNLLNHYYRVQDGVNEYNEPIFVLDENDDFVFEECTIYKMYQLKELNINNIYTKTESDNKYQPKGNYLTEHQDISGKADINHTHSQYLTEHQDISGKADKTDTYSKSQVDDLINNIEISSDVYTKTESDSKYQVKGNYLTEHQDISGKVDKIEGKGLSTNDFTDSYKNKLDNLEENISDIPSKMSELENDNYYVSSYTVHNFEQPVLTSNGIMGGDSFAVSDDNGDKDSNKYWYFDRQDGLEGHGGISSISTYNCLHFFEIYNPIPINVTKLTALGNDDDFEGTKAESVYVKGSNDRTNWTDIVFSGILDSTGLTLDNTEEYKYYRIRVQGYYKIAHIYITATYITQDTIPKKTSDLINDSGFLTSHQDISGKVDKVTGKGLSTNDYTTEEKTKLAGLSNYDDTEILSALDGKADVNHTHSQYLTEHQDISGKVDKVTGKGLSTEDYTTEEKTKLAGLSNYDDTEILSALDGKADVNHTHSQYLTEHQDISGKVDKVTGKGLSTNDYTTEEKTKLAGLSNYDDTEILSALDGKADVNHTHSQYLTEHQDISGKVDKVTGKGLSTNDYTTEEKTKLAGLSNYDDTEILSALDGKADVNHTHSQYLTEHQDISGKVDKVTGKGLSTNDFTDSYKNKLDNLEENISIPTDNSELTNGAGYITGINRTDVINALGYTPYNSTNPAGYTANVGTITGIQMNNTTVGTSGVVNLGDVMTIQGNIGDFTPVDSLSFGLYYFENVSNSQLPVTTNASGFLISYSWRGQVCLINNKMYYRQYDRSLGRVGNWQVAITDSDLSVKQDKSNLVTSLSANSTDTQYPSAKCVYDLVGNIETLLSEV